MNYELGIFNARIFDAHLNHVIDYSNKCINFPPVPKIFKPFAAPQLCGEYIYADTLLYYA